MKCLARKKWNSKTPVYNIGMASRLAGLPIWTLRWIEKNGLVCPCRSGGNQRLFSEEDMGLLSEIRDLVEKNVNLPGIRVILKMRQGRSTRVNVHPQRRRI